MAKKPVKKQKRESTPTLPTGWGNLDRAFENFRRDLERSFTSFPSFSMPSFPKIPEARCDVVDEGTQFTVKMDVPGVKKNEIDLNVTDNSIQISAQHKEESEKKKKNYLSKERSEVSYYRTIPLPEKVLSGKTNAKLVDGILTVTLPKQKPSPKSKKKSITVR